MSKPTSASPSTPPQTSSSAETSEWIRGTVFVALFAALFISACFVKSAPGAAVPYSLQSFAIMLAGGLIGSVYGFWSIFLVVALTAVGLPLMNGSGGFSQVFGPTGGFIWMFPVSALLIGWASDRIFAAGGRKLNPSRFVLLLLAVLVFGVLLLFVTGVPWLAHSTDMDFSGAVKNGMLLFLPADIAKAIAATFIIAALRPALPVIRPSKKSKG